MFAPQRYQTFDVMRLLDQARHVIGIKNNDLPPAGPAEVIGEAVYEQVVAAVLSEFDDVLSGINPLTVMKLAMVLQVVRREPDAVRDIAHPQRLTFDKRKNRFRRLNTQLAIVFCHFVIVMNP